MKKKREYWVLYRSKFMEWECEVRCGSCGYPTLKAAEKAAKKCKALLGGEHRIVELIERRGYK